MDFKDIDVSPEVREKAKACTSPEELIELAKKEGYKLSEQDLEAISGGSWVCSSDCGGDCHHQWRGDSRGGIDSARVHADFVNGVVDGGELD